MSCFEFISRRMKMKSITSLNCWLAAFRSSYFIQNRWTKKKKKQFISSRLVSRVELNLLKYFLQAFMPPAISQGIFAQANAELTCICLQWTRVVSSYLSGLDPSTNRALTEDHFYISLITWKRMGRAHSPSYSRNSSLKPKLSSTTAVAFS